MNGEIWYILPSASLEAANESLRQWRAMGYRVAVLIDPHGFEDYEVLADLVIAVDDYFGYPWAINRILSHPGVREAPVVVAGGDDMFPDPKPPEKIALEFTDRFPDGFGVMQPTGDGHRCDQICGSPWMGRKFVRTINGGRGPFWPEYRHFFADREMKEVAERLGILWQRPDLRHRHDHWSWSGRRRPEHMKATRQWHAHDRDLFQRRCASDFPGHEPL